MSSSLADLGRAQSRVKYSIIIHLAYDYVVYCIVAKRTVTCAHKELNITYRITTNFCAVFIFANFASKPSVAKI